MVWVGDSEVKVILQNNGMEAFIPQVRGGGAVQWGAQGAPNTDLEAWPQMTALGGLQVSGEVRGVLGLTFKRCNPAATTAALCVGVHVFVGETEQRVCTEGCV